MKKAVQYGAGNIGRGFIGQLFSQSGYEVAFIDVNMEVVSKLNEDRQYPVRVVSERNPGEITVKNVYGVDGRDMEAVASTIAEADIMATAVGVNILPRVAKPIALGLKKRWESGNLVPLNIIICENLLNADRYLAELVEKELNRDEITLFREKVGLVEASIGRMVPVMTPEMQAGNILRVCVEEFCELPVDRDAFKGEIPRVQNMLPFSPFKFYIERKLFIHNMGHALTAYLGYLSRYGYLWEAIKNPYIKLIASRAMQESAAALSKEHGVPLEEILEHVDDLLYRFGNRYLGDTVERVGKDPVRKLSPNDRLVGALKLCIKHQVKPVYICLGVAAAMCFEMPGDESAAVVKRYIAEGGAEQVLEKICGLDGSTGVNPLILKFHKALKSGITPDELLAAAEDVKDDMRKNSIRL